MSEATDERRRTRRRMRIEEHGIVAARVRPGHDAVVVDVSADGALVESPHRLLPGTIVELQLETTTHRMAVRGMVVRCRVARLRSTVVSYQGAIAFDRQLPWFSDDSGYRVHALEQPRVDPSRNPL